MSDPTIYPVVTAPVIRPILGDDGDPGPPGDDGAPGPPGDDGAPGAPGGSGLSAYEVAVSNGFIGDQAAWLASLVGAPGAPGAPGAKGDIGIPTVGGNLYLYANYV